MVKFKADRRTQLPAFGFLVVYLSALIWDSTEFYGGLPK